MVFYRNFSRLFFDAFDYNEQKIEQLIHLAKSNLCVYVCQKSTHIARKLTAILFSRTVDFYGKINISIELESPEQKPLVLRSRVCIEIYFFFSFLTQSNINTLNIIKSSDFIWTEISEKCAFSIFFFLCLFSFRFQNAVEMIRELRSRIKSDIFRRSTFADSGVISLSHCTHCHTDRNGTKNAVFLFN